MVTMYVTICFSLLGQNWLKPHKCNRMLLGNVYVQFVTWAFFSKIIIIYGQSSTFIGLWPFSLFTKIWVPYQRFRLADMCLFGTVTIFCSRYTEVSSCLQEKFLRNMELAWIRSCGIKKTMHRFPSKGDACYWRYCFIHYTFITKWCVHHSFQWQSYIFCVTNHEINQLQWKNCTSWSISVCLCALQ